MKAICLGLGEDMDKKLKEKILSSSIYNRYFNLLFNLPYISFSIPDLMLMKEVEPPYL